MQLFQPNFTSLFLKCCEPTQSCERTTNDDNRSPKATLFF
jgi:hypothetical protein